MSMNKVYEYNLMSMNKVYEYGWMSMERANPSLL